MRLFQNNFIKYLSDERIISLIKISPVNLKEELKNINDENEKLLVAFKKAGMIDNYKESSEKEGYYKITRHKPAVKALPQELL